MILGLAQLLGLTHNYIFLGLGNMDVTTLWGFALNEQTNYKSSKGLLCNVGTQFFNGDNATNLNFSGSIAIDRQREKSSPKRQKELRRLDDIISEALT